MKPVSRDDISRIEDDLADITAELRKMRVEWAAANMDTADLEIDKAVGFVEYMKSTWVHRCYAQFRQSLAKDTAEKRRTEMKKKRS